MPDNNLITQLCGLTKARSLQQLCDLTYQIVGNPVFVADLAHTILAYTKCVPVDDPTWQNTIVSANLERNTLKQDRQVSSVHDASVQSLRPVLVEDDELPFPRIIRTLMHNGQPVGVMVVTAYLAPFAENALELVELIASFMVPCLVRERYHVSDDKRAVENYLIRLLDGASYTADQVRKRLDVLGYPRAEYSYVLCAYAIDGEEDSVSVPELERELAEVLHGKAFTYDSAIVCVFGDDTPFAEREIQRHALTELLDRRKLVAGVSRRVEDLSRLRDYYLQARDILGIGRRLGRHTNIYPYDSFSSFLLFDRIPRDELNRYCHQKIQALAEYDGAHSTDLCSTLQVYLDQSKSLARTADVLYIHRNTVRYRINRCMELLDSRLEDANEVFSYMLSLRVLEYQSKILNVLPAQNPFGTKEKR